MGVYFVCLCYNYRIQVCNSKNHVRVVQHLHFTAWPDHGVPKYATAVLEFQKKVDKKHKRKCNKPMLVHCRYPMLIIEK